ncbi:hypothetical protein HBI25_051660 [Parastagonospora nodorum]|nr:hypothetical protein HBH52_027310 [Parastagonospora nodorum]KAH4259056.1 hypothetical protein HBI03_140150 [Parastagonospora nodorum]KAH4276478.1 hypothetical protein HBI04_109270 [Parastagonospora nodorum]KAH4902606.1 hypothetical protein HBI80_125420 [Parastagonospora nodorum]KAH5074101.1 hypothetical protein HBH95_145270 [Parastagonospora nodorum]
MNTMHNNRLVSLNMHMHMHIHYSCLGTKRTKTLLSRIAIPPKPRLHSQTQSQRQTRALQNCFPNLTFSVLSLPTRTTRRPKPCPLKPTKPTVYLSPPLRSLGPTRKAKQSKAKK